MKRKILIVEDDRDLNSSIAKFLRLKGFETLSAFDGNDALEKVYEMDFDTILLDVKLPFRDGFEVAKEIRDSKSTPIIF
ncbi:MAG: response regulator [Sulfurimonas sp.]|nr:response regulator [Sulfurimonas sp.]